MFKNAFLELKKNLKNLSNVRILKRSVVNFFKFCKIILIILHCLLIYNIRWRLSVERNKPIIVKHLCPMGLIGLICYLDLLMVSSRPNMQETSFELTVTRPWFQPCANAQLDWLQLFQCHTVIFTSLNPPTGSASFERTTAKGIRHHAKSIHVFYVVLFRAEIIEQVVAEVMFRCVRSPSAWSERQHVTDTAHKLFTFLFAPSPEARPVT